MKQMKKPKKQTIKRRKANKKLQLFRRCFINMNVHIIFLTIEQLYSISVSLSGVANTF